MKLPTSKALCLVSLLSLTLLGCTPGQAQTQKVDLTCHVVKIADGDTFTCLTEQREQVRVRLKNIDAPETKQDFSSVSSNALAEMIFQRDVDLVQTEKDRYGRTLAVVLVKPSGDNVNEYMVANGHAWAYTHFIKDKDDKRLYKRLEDKAIEEKRGLWAHPRPIPPWDFRRMK